MTNRATVTIVIALVLASVVAAVASMMQLQNYLHRLEEGRYHESESIKLTIYAGEYGFGYAPDNITSPGPTITLKLGEKVVLEFVSAGKLPHTFAIVPERRFEAKALWGVEIGKTNMPIPPGQSRSVTFVPDRPGRYYYVCTVPGHIELGMWGTLIVEAQAPHGSHAD